MRSAKASVAITLQFNLLNPASISLSSLYSHLDDSPWSIPFACQRFTLCRILSGVGSLVENRHRGVLGGEVGSWALLSWGQSWALCPIANAASEAPQLLRLIRSQRPQSKVRPIRFGGIGAAGSPGVFSPHEIEREPLSLCGNSVPCFTDCCLFPSETCREESCPLQSLGRTSVSAGRGQAI